MPKPNLAKTLDFFVSLMTDPHSDPAMQAREMQRAYESLVVSQNGRIRNSEYSPLVNRARQGDSTALAFLALLSMQLDQKDTNVKRGLSMQEQEFTDRSLSYSTRSKSPLANKLRSEYRAELDHIMERLPSLQVDSLWNEILLYAKLGLNSLNKSRPRGSPIPALGLYLPEITETPTTNFLHFPLANVFSRQPVQLRESDRKYLDEGRQFAESGYLGANSSAELIKIVSKAMGQFAQVHGIDVSSRIDYANKLAEKLEGGNFIETFEWVIRERLYGLAGEGQALRTFGELKYITERAQKHNVPLDLLLSGKEIAALKAQAVNHPAFGLRGELLDILREVAAGNTGRRLDLERTDELVQFCDDPTLVSSYNIIKSAIEHLASEARKPYTGEPRLPTRPIAIPAKVPVVETASSDLIASIPFNPRAMENMTRKMVGDRRMTSDDARNILFMFLNGDYNGIRGYRFSDSHRSIYAQSNVPAERVDRSDTYRKVAAVAGLAAVASLVMILADKAQMQISEAYAAYQASIQSRQGSNTQRVIEVDCGDLPQWSYGASSQSNVGQISDPTYVCKPGTEPKVPRGDISLPIESSSGTGPRHRVVDGENLTRIMRKHRIARNGSPYLAALTYAKEHGIKPPYIIYPGQILVIGNPK